jgi:hypothetical protein
VAAKSELLHKPLRFGKDLSKTSDQQVEVEEVLEISLTVCREDTGRVSGIADWEVDEDDIDELGNMSVFTWPSYCRMELTTNEQAA